MASLRLARLWAAWAGPWRNWRDRLFRWIGSTNSKRCPGCGFVADEAGDPRFGPPLCPRCGARFDEPGQ